MMDKVIMDNFSLEATSKGEEHFVPLMRMAFSAECAGNVATHYRITGDKMELFWNEMADTKELPYPMTASQAIQFVWNWLEDVQIEEKGPDIDGDAVADAFKITSGYADGWSYAIVRIEKAWRLISK